MTPCLPQKPENCCCYGRVSRLWTLKKNPMYLRRKNRWHHDVTMSPENSHGYLWIPWEFYSSLADQIMCYKQSALEIESRSFMECDWYVASIVLKVAIRDTHLWCHIFFISPKKGWVYVWTISNHIVKDWYLLVGLYRWSTCITLN